MGNRSRPGPIRWLAMIVGSFLLPGCGGGPRLEFHSDEPGNFRVLMAGKPSRSKQTVTSPGGPLEIASTSSVDAGRIRRVVAYADLTDAAVRSSDPGALLDGGARKMGGGGPWSVESQGPIALGGHPGREIRFAVDSPSAAEKGSGRARIFLVGHRLYEAIMVGPASTVTEEEFDHFVKSFELLREVPAIAGTATAAGPAVAVAVADRAAPAPVPAPATIPPPQPPALAPDPGEGIGPTVATRDAPTPPRPGRRRPPFAPPRRQAVERAPFNRPSRSEERVVQTGDEGPSFLKPAEVPIEASQSGGFLSAIPEPSGNPREQFRELAPPRGVLVGLRVGYVEIFGGPKVAMVEPIFQVGNRYVPGKRHGKPIRPEMTVVARPGYAIGAISTRTGLTVDAFQVEFMRFKDGRLDPDDSYTTNWLGDPRGGSPRDASGEGRLVVGIHGRSNGREINMLGLVTAE